MTLWKERGFYSQVALDLLLLNVTPRTSSLVSLYLDLFIFKYLSPSVVVRIKLDNTHRMQVYKSTQRKCWFLY